jgi:hypothetical protein
MTLNGIRDELVPASIASVRSDFPVHGLDEVPREENFNKPAAGHYMLTHGSKITQYI